MKDPVETLLKHQICDRLKHARKARGFATAKEFALTSGLKISTYSLHEAGTRAMSFDVIEHYCKLLDIKTSWLLTGEQSEPGSVLHKIPIIEWEEVLFFPEKVDVLQKAWTSSDVDLSLPSFALKVKEDSMEPRYPRGTLLLVDLTQKPLDRDFALFKLSSSSVCFRQLVEIKGQWFMRALNAEHPLEKMTQEVQLLGKVVQAKLKC